MYRPHKPICDIELSSIYIFGFRKGKLAGNGKIIFGPYKGKSRLIQYKKTSLKVKFIPFFTDKFTE